MDWIGLDPWVDGLDWVSKNGPMSNSDSLCGQLNAKCSTDSTAVLQLVHVSESVVFILAI